MAVLVIAFAATTLDTATRIQRFILTELGIVLRFKLLTNRYAATIVAILPAIFLWVFLDVSCPILMKPNKGMGSLAPIWCKQSDVGGVNIDGINFIFLAEE
ncbi:MAG: hypothetical protein Ct9H300mP29_5850 [Candidatus Neomarinimicrobiota bacterium]|nr:MAG: hypothetical protein Ct9H300mP29_5850 [Candidatus Neomarinimicrobiota bacterium]